MNIIILKILSLSTESKCPILACRKKRVYDNVFELYNEFLENYLDP